jgi:hypothetical protein
MIHERPRVEAGSPAASARGYLEATSSECKPIVRTLRPDLLDGSGAIRLTGGWAAALAGPRPQPESSPFERACLCLRRDLGYALC